MSKYRVIDSFKKIKPVDVIYSQWKGYLECSNAEYFGAEQVSHYQSNLSVHFTYAHTSGHAPVGDLQRFAEALKPKMLVPVHTEHPNNFVDFFDNVIYFKEGIFHEI
jgi:ribonuclease J